MKSTGDRPIACVCGGHETSNSATVASSDAIIVDVCRMKAISMQDDGKGGCWSTHGGAGSGGS